MTDDYFCGGAGVGAGVAGCVLVGCAGIPCNTDLEPVLPPRELIYCRFPLLDGTGNPPELLTLAVQTVTELLRRQVPTAVCCGNGVSRSPAVAAAALAVFQRLDLADSLKRISDQHRCDVSPGLLHDLREALRPRGIN